MAARIATSADVETITTIITLGFAKDPIWSRALSRPDGVAVDTAEFWELWVRGALRYPWVWLTEGGEATSIWIPPDGTEMSAEQEAALAQLAVSRLGPAAADFDELLDRFDAAHPRDEPHYYLSLLATHPAHRGRGIGMALLAANLVQIDAERMPAYLESSNPANDRRYAAAGFEPVGSFSHPGDGPTVTTMWRRAVR